MTEFPSLSDIRSAQIRLDGRLRLTPAQASPSLSSTHNEVILKLEHQQLTGSFKLRGATNAVLSLSEEERSAGVVSVSTGNHGRGLAYAAKQACVRCVICMSELVPQVKVDGIRAQGAEVCIVGRSQDDAEMEVKRLVENEGMTQLPPFDHADIIAGQGTVGLELLAQAPQMQTVLVPLSGGGLISGVAIAIKAQRPDVRIIGVSMERGAAMYQCQRAGRPVQVEELSTIADSLGGGIGLNNRYTFDIVRNLVDDMILVSEREIAAAINHAYWHERQIIEGSGAVGIAAVLAGKVNEPGPVIIVVSGGNIGMEQHFRLISGETEALVKEIESDA